MRTKTINAMNAISLETTDQKYLISIDREGIDQPAFYAFFERLRIELLAQKMNTDETDLMNLSDEIKENWWQKNQEKIVKIVTQHTDSQL